MSNYIEDCITGDALMSEIYDYIDQWHEGDSKLSISEYLGMSEKEYFLFVENDSYLPSIITAHKTDKNIVTVMQEYLKMAARSDDPNKTKNLQQWLENEGLWD
jgi:hypothetical protein